MIKSMAASLNRPRDSPWPNRHAGRVTQNSLLAIPHATCCIGAASGGLRCNAALHAGSGQGLIGQHKKRMLESIQSNQLQST